MSNETEVIKHQVYSLDAVFKAIEPYLKEGFSFDFYTNEGYPIQIGTVFSFHVLKKQPECKSKEIPENTTLVQSDDTATDVDHLPEVSDKPKTRRASARLGS